MIIITLKERDWLNALWRQSVRDAAPQWFGQPPPFPFPPKPDGPWCPPINIFPPILK